ncbi:MAG: hypothetical protein HY282_03530 [Nitrospirae bacterium]|nr:hypothetical protein [Candidatus Manganitrophaceae bacterium]
MEPLNATDLSAPTEMPAASPYLERRVGRLHLTVRTDWNSPAFIAFLSGELNAPRALEKIERIPSSVNTAVYRIEAFRRPVYLKVFLYNHWRHAMTAPFAASKGHRAWTAGRWMDARGFLTPPLLALGEERRLGFIRKSFFVTEEVAGVRLSKLLEQKELLDCYSGGRLFERIGKLLGAFHREGMIHGDLNVTNFLVRSVEPLGPPEIYFLDNEGCREADPTRAAAMALDDLRSFFGRQVRSLPIDAQREILEGYLSEYPAMRASRPMLEQGLRIG